jgi:hypothetical protein
LYPGIQKSSPGHVQIRLLSGKGKVEDSGVGRDGQNG